MTVTPFLIVGTYRSGSSAFAEQLSVAPEIACGWESADHLWFGNRAKLTEQILSGSLEKVRPDERLHYASQLSTNTKSLGFRMLFRSDIYWIFEPRFGFTRLAEGFDLVLRWIQAHPDVHIIHIVRRSNERWLISMAYSKATGNYIDIAYPNDLKVDICVNHAIKRVKKKHHLGKRLHELRESNPYQLVEYEQFRASNQDIVASSQRFLGCTPKTHDAQTYRTQPQSNARHVLSNQDSIRKALEAEGLLQDTTGLHV